ncbi:tetratricopeptide repeat protein [Phocaeicola paurosaccharolyticus]|jgi:uncharacterized protein|uniref:tetratricopeptide repeat protein n=1 Tax=Phocaeicola paurosaccharolyticus TaxID=732242 RepID=UPI00046964E6|nr:tetratricopeptide repeat protein [Phocaeicola paurosaccharolyticus]
MRKYIYHLYGIGICILIASIILIIDRSNNIYAWTLGDLSSRYDSVFEAINSHDYITARQELKPLARIDSAKFAQYSLGDLYYRGLGGEKDYDKAYKLFKESAENGNMDAMNNIAFMSLYGHGTDVNYAKAYELFRNAALQGNPHAQLGLGTMYRHGWGVTRSCMLAMDWYKRSASHGNSDAMNNIGYMQYNGIGVPMDSQQAFYWFSRAAVLGNPIAEYNMGVLYCVGRGVDHKDLVKGAEWLTKSAMKGNSSAQYNLGNMYYFGKGVEKDVEKAELWYRAAAKEGHKRASFTIKDLENKGYIEPKDSLMEFDVED